MATFQRATFQRRIFQVGWLFRRDVEVRLGTIEPHRRWSMQLAGPRRIASLQRRGLHAELQARGLDMDVETRWRLGAATTRRRS